MRALVFRVGHSGRWTYNLVVGSWVDETWVHWETGGDYATWRQAFDTACAHLRMGAES